MWNLFHSDNNKQSSDAADDASDAAGRAGGGGRSKKKNVARGVNNLVTNTISRSQAVLSSDNRSPQQHHQQFGIMETEFGAVEAEPLKLHLLLPGNQRVKVVVSPFSSFAQLKVMIASLVGVADVDQINVFSRNKLQGRLTKNKWESVGLQNSESLIGKVAYGDELRVQILNATAYFDDYQGVITEQVHQQNTFVVPTDDCQIHQHRQSPYAVPTEKPGDALYAMRLQQEECGAHHERIILERDQATAVRNDYAPQPVDTFQESARAATSQSHQAASTYKPGPTDSFHPTEGESMMGGTGVPDYGEVITRGTLSQYSVGGAGGESACTSICLVEAKHLLVYERNKQQSNPIDSLTPNMLDMMVTVGVKKHQQAMTGHSNLEDLWSVPAFADQVAGLERGPPTQGNVGLEGFMGALEAAWLYATSQHPSNPRVAVVLTKSPETVLCFACGPDEWYFLDSHGESSAQEKRAYIVKHPSSMSLALALQSKFPALPGGSENWQTQMYNLFDATPLVASLSQPQESSPDVPIQATADATQVETTPVPRQVNPMPPPAQRVNPAQHHPGITGPSPSRRIDSNDEGASWHPSSRPLGPRRSQQQNRGDPVTQNVPESPPLQGVRAAQEEEGKGKLPEGLDIDSFLDPVMFFVMADPVFCHSGWTYERTTIEEHFRVRRKEEEERIRREEEAEAQERQAQNPGIEEDDEAVCCGARRPIKLTCPKTLQEIPDILVPNHALATQIVSLVEKNALGMTEEEIADWKQRREEKKVRDREREEREKKLREEHEQRMRNRAEAERRRAEEAARTPYNLVRVLRRGNELISRDDLGVAVALCEVSDTVSDQSASRCRVACCKVRLAAGTTSACARCGRSACETCLGFRASKYTLEQGSSNDLHRICAECVMQVVDVMPREGPMGQARDVILQSHITPYISAITEQALEAQDSKAQASAEAEFSSGIRQLEADIEELQDTKSRLQSQIEAAEREAEQARIDDGSSNVPDLSQLMQPVQEWEEVTAELAQEYEQLLSRNIDANDEDAQFAHFQAISEINNRLEEAQTSLAMARSRLAEAQDAATELAHGSSQTNRASGHGSTPSMSPNSSALQEREEAVRQLQQQYDQLVNANVAFDDEDATFEHFQAVSEIMSRLEAARCSLAVAQSEAVFAEESHPENRKIIKKTTIRHVSPTKPTPKMKTGNKSSDTKTTTIRRTTPSPRKAGVKGEKSKANGTKGVTSTTSTEPDEKSKKSDSVEKITRIEKDGTVFVRKKTTDSNGRTTVETTKYPSVKIAAANGDL